jgi:lantibiotic biosynthesis protein
MSTQNNNDNDIGFVDIADSIGRRLCSQAYWLGDQCNWIGRTTSSSTYGYYRKENRALGPQLYDGTSGIALFLSYLYDFTKNEEYYRTAKAAINHALLHIKYIPPISRFGFYRGHIGVAYVSARIGKIFDDNTLVENSASILEKLCLDVKGKHLMDVMSGNAGAIPALLDIYYNIIHEQKIYKLALTLGKELVSSSVKEPVGYSWDSRSNSIPFTSHNLTGFAHGAAGIGYGLLELYNETNLREYLYAAENAFAYENYWFDKQEDNWPDFRRTTMTDEISITTSTTTNTKISKNEVQKNEDKNASNSLNRRYAIAWCHGAPGIGFSRLRAYRLLKDQKYVNDSVAAIRTSTKVLRQEIAATHKQSDFCLCHGLSGICELLLYAYEILNDSSYKSTVVDVAVDGIKKYVNGGLPWPCGIPTGEPLDLMLGLAGIGHFYLRLHDSAKVPSPLLILPRSS